jgi:hypothetical protein
VSGRGIRRLVTPVCGTVTQLVSENDRQLPRSEDDESDLKKPLRLVEQVCLCFRTTLTIIDTPRKVFPRSTATREPHLPRSGSRHLRSYESSTNPTCPAHPLRVVFMLNNVRLDTTTILSFIKPHAAMREPEGSSIPLILQE